MGESNLNQNVSYAVSRLVTFLSPCYSRLMAPEADLTSIHVSLPRAQREFVEAEAARAGCTTTSEYFRRLIAEAQNRASQEKLERLLLEGLESGEPIQVSKEYWEKKRQQLEARHNQRKPS
jgi:antitoxin ParD1/3/4